ncbi:hypothetical protein [Gluconobacter kanchanaburiensis]|uniref:Uncharacterized protein n=1 Tax=Gluconobacter kanchanaburiensis NBRC 103587 TaxID=1307948 RepID=A0A511B3K3_9PROT|nr:hypothetical protein [Gluconobacter kanchanaburiensis]MBF0860819.1 hypothetical protein [Gluconobacter kanchanaburiensis]GBR69859.1 hypothetical protein AA103587_1555 [Gluconobacter kanchanaburiensis NBRC 103587]GEK95004.1 hypothetical protein GKA01_02010 [Gluconobacter kanchanaburiensis NBRC 103587]
MRIFHGFGLLVLLLCAINTAHAGDNPRLKTMFDTDQAEREQEPINWKTLIPNDTKRRAELHRMLEQNTVTTGLDYYEAAFIQQHGLKPDDYLLAHVLAMAALAKGYTQARWIAAATLDRYLQQNQHPQIFGTQTVIRTVAGTGKEEAPTRAPFNTTLLPDSLRSTLGVADLKTLANRLSQKDYHSSDSEN